MKIHEFQAKQLFREAGIAVPEGIVAKTPEEAAAAFKRTYSRGLGALQPSLECILR